ncbi:phospholipase D-like domain-containing protein [Roseofilum sp. BLCC_M154]|uniref:Phospholipase D-like domain-containing protein n=1 Tax=Roseofilum acuticapitatum BLCC-M154 TaxID=3022444 RepID=A0ABT7AMD7_9CYAN|nr:phospholipase D-like domain-containing protein [Roseofilum acuticapitatum]MDJ1168069.1 phospholipase D-like domain-containing protein [Roseofilum acuticapitatum BLCC-M154]
MNVSYEDLRCYDNRPGFDLVSCQEVGLPVYKITVDVLTQIRKSIPPIEEFVLRSIDAGLSSEEEIAGFLGLELSTTSEAMVNLRLSEDIDLIAPDPSQIPTWKLTKKGERTLKEAKIIVPEERTFDINFDGLLRIPRWYGRFEKALLKPKDLRDKGILEIEPSPKNPPELSDLSIKDIDKVIREVLGNGKGLKSKNDNELDILALKEIERRQRFFQPSTALVYKAKDSDEIQVAFIVDGLLSSDHEAAFARSNGAKKITSQILNALQENEPLKLATEILGNDFVANNLIDLDPIVEQVSEATSKIESEIELTQKQLEQTDDPSEQNDFRKKLKEQENEIAGLKDQLQSVISSCPMRWLEMYDHRPLLEQALKDTQERLMIVSPWIRANSVNSWFLQQLQNLLKRGVQVFIGYGLGEKDENRYSRDIKAEKTLQKLADQYPKSFILKRLGDTHAKILISDTKFAVTTSFNWLSFKGERDRTFRDERGTLVSDPEKIDELFDCYEAKMR